jgi:hypothetical protein
MPALLNFSSPKWGLPLVTRTKPRGSYRLFSQIAAGDVEKAVEEALMQEVERKQQQPAEAASGGGPGLPGTSAGARGWGPQASSHVQNVF